MDLFEITRELSNGKTIYDLNLRVTYYARVSTDTDEQAHSLDNQIGYYRDYIVANPNWTFVEGYVDKGISGTSVEKRENFLRMIQDAKLKKFDFIITKEISRFSRNTVDSLQYTQELLRYGVGVFFQADNINTLQKDGELRLALMTSIAQDEVRKISERVRFGFKRSISNGVVLGASNIWGYTKDNGKLVIDETEAKVVKRIFEIYVYEHIGIRKISDKLAQEGIYGRKGKKLAFSTIRGILKNPKYKGYYCGNKTCKIDYKLKNVKYINECDWVQYKDYESVPPIVSEELWEQANALLNDRSEKMSSENKTSYQNKYKYSGKIFCAKHNEPFYRAYFRYDSGDKEVWRCKVYQYSGKNACDSPIVYTYELDMILREAYNIIVKDKTRIIKELIDLYKRIDKETNISSEIARIDVQIQELQRKKDKILNLVIEEKISDVEFKYRNDAFNEAIANLDMKKEELEIKKNEKEDVEKTAETLRQILTQEIEFSEEIPEEIVDNLLEKVIVDKGENSKEVKLQVYFKVFDTFQKCTLIRARKNTSVCYQAHIYHVTNRSFHITHNSTRIRKRESTINMELYIIAGR